MSAQRATAAAVAARAHPFDESQHPRGTHGQFAAGGSHAERHEHNVRTLVRAGVLPKLVTHSDGSVIEHAGSTRKVINGPTPRAADRTQEPINDSRWMQEPRTRATMPGYYRTASKTPGMPVQYTGSDRKEAPVGQFLVHQLTDQKPKSVSSKDHHDLKASLFNMVTNLAEPTIAQGKLPKRRGKLRGQTLIPEGTPEITARRAFTHAAMTALHTYGTLKYDFAMDDKLKEELKPLSGFMLYAQRRVADTMFAGEKGRYQRYREEFGETFADKRRDKRTGEVRLHMTPRKQLIKAERIGSLAKAYDASKHPREHDGTFSRKTGETIGRAVGSNVGITAGTLGGLAYGAQAGRKIGGAAARAYSKLGWLRSGKPGWHRALDAEMAEMAGRARGGRIGGAYGHAVGAVALGTAGYIGGRALGRAFDDSRRKKRAIKAGKLASAAEA